MTDIQYFRYDTTFLFHLCKNTNMFTCFDFNLFLPSEISCPALLKICSDGTDDPKLERFLQVWIQGATTTR